MQDSDQRNNNADSSKQISGLPVVRHEVAGIDLGSERHWVCAATVEGGGREVADFGATTCELNRMAKWLKARKVESVAMESTGVYWIAPHEVLEAEFRPGIAEPVRCAEVAHNARDVNIFTCSFA